jgi:hypothetical protein
MLMKTLFVALLTGAGLIGPITASAATTAYWRHEEGPAGGFISAGIGTDTVLDASGNGNHMQTFNPAFTSATYTSTVSPLPLTSGLANTLALNFGPGGDDGGLNDDNFSDGKAINGQLFTAMTVELAFNMNMVEDVPPTEPRLFQALFGKDGKPTAGVVPPFKVLIRGDDFPNAIANQLFVEWIDGDGDVHFVASGQSVAVGEWNHVAFTLTPTTAELWVASETGPYSLLHSISGDFAGAGGEVLFNSTANYTIGRGQFNGGNADFSDALIDEVRVSDVALSRENFLFAAVPEPATWLMAAAAVAGGFLRRGRRETV